MSRKLFVFTWLLSVLLFATSSGCFIKSDSEISSPKQEDEISQTENLSPAGQILTDLPDDNDVPREKRFSTWLQTAVKFGQFGMGSIMMLTGNSTLAGLKLVTKSLKQNNVMLQAAKKFEESPEGAKLLETMYGMEQEGELYWPTVFKLEDYRNYPEDTFGGAYYRFM